MTKQTFTVDYGLAIIGGNTITSDTGNVAIVGNATVSADLTAQGNIAGNYILGNVAFANGIPATYGNSNVANFMGNYGSNGISTTGTVTFGNTYINGEVSTTGNVTGANVIGYSFYANGLISASGNVDAQAFHGNLFGNTVSNITITPDAHFQFNVGTVANVVYINDGGMVVDGGVNGFISAAGNISAANINAVTDITGGNILTGGKVSAVGAIFGSNAIISGNITANAINANTFTGSNVTANGNIATNWLNISNVGNIASLQANVSLQIVADAGNTAPYWTFNSDGNLYVPGSINGDNNGPLLIDGASAGLGYISLPHSTFGAEQIAIVNNWPLGAGIRLETPGGNLVFNESGDLTAPATVTSGNLSVTGNVVGDITFTGANILINNNTGAGAGDEGGELHFAAATANSTLSGPLAIDVYQNKMRFFDTQGNTYGMYIDIANTMMGVAGSSLGVPAIGYRDVPQIALSANVTANVTNAGKHFYSTTAGNIVLTIPDNANVAFPTGATLTVVMNAAGNVIVAQGTGVSLYMAGSSSTGNRAVGAYGLASVMKVATDTWVISGTGVY